jgi:MFS family permease
LALTPEQTVESNWVGLSFFLALASLAGCIAMGFDSPWVLSLAVFGLLLLPLSGLFRCATGWPRWTMLAVVIVLMLLGLGAIISAWRAYLGESQYEKATASVAFGLLGLFSVGVLISTFLANFLASQQPKR